MVYPKSQPYKCEGNNLKEIWYGTIERFVYDAKKRLYIGTGEQRSIHLTPNCNPKCTEAPYTSWCMFTDTDNIATASN